MLLILFLIVTKKHYRLFVMISFCYTLISLIASGAAAFFIVSLQFIKLSHSRGFLADHADSYFS